MPNFQPIINTGSNLFAPVINTDLQLEPWSAAGGGTSGYQMIGGIDSQLDSGFSYLVGQHYPSYSVGQFTYPGQTTQYFLDNIDVANGSGFTLEQFVDDTKLTTFVLYGGTNDLVLEGRSASYVFGKLQAIITAVKARGIDKVIVGTISSLYKAGATQPQLDAIEAERVALNTLLRAKTGNAFNSGANAVIDFGGTAELGQQESVFNTYWFLTTGPEAVDLHWSYGKNIVYEMLFAAQTRLVAGETGFSITTHTQVDPNAGGGGGNEDAVPAVLSSTSSRATTISGNNWDVVVAELNALGDNQVVGTQAIPANSDGYVEITLNQSRRAVRHGLKPIATATTYDGNDFSVLVDSSTFTVAVRVNGSPVVSGVAYNNMDVVRVARVGTSGVASLAGTVLHTQPNVFLATDVLTYAATATGPLAGGTNIMMQADAGLVSSGL